MVKFLLIFSAIIITSLFCKKNGNAQTNLNILDTVQPKTKALVFTKVETEASFPGGVAAWEKYIAMQISKNKLRKKDTGTCMVRFMVDTDGNITNVEAITRKGTALATFAVNAIRKGPKWIPAQQSNQEVTAWRLQPVTINSIHKKLISSGPRLNYIKIEDTKKNTVPKDYQKILILGMGTSSVRMVVEKLYEEIAVGLKNRKMQSSFYFLGSNKEGINHNADQPDKEKYDAALIFKQASDSYFMESYVLRELPRLSIKLDQDIIIQLIEFKGGENLIWEARMAMDFTISSKKFYKKISNQIIKNMKGNLLVK